MLGKTNAIKSYVTKNGAEEINLPTTKNGWSCLQVAAGYGRPETVRALIELGAAADTKDKGGMTAVHAGADTDETDVIRALLETEGGKACVNGQDADGCTALHYAAYSGRVDIVAELMRAGADVEIKDGEGRTASEIAKEVKQDGVTKMIANGPPEIAATA